MGCTKTWRSQLGRWQGLRRVQVVELVVLQKWLCQQLSGDWKRAYAQVAQLITHTVRASSAVECHINPLGADAIVFQANEITSFI